MEFNMNMNTEDWSWFSQQLRGKVADSHTLIEKIRELEAQNNVLQSKFDSITVSFRDLNDLYLKETKKTSRLQDELKEVEKKSALRAETNERLVGENRFLQLQSEQLGAVDGAIEKLEKEKTGLKRKINDILRKCSRNHISKKEHESRNLPELIDYEIPAPDFRNFEKFPEPSNVDCKPDLMETCGDALLETCNTIKECKPNTKEQCTQSTMTETSELSKKEDKPDKVLISTSTMTEDPEKPELIARSTMTETIKTALSSTSTMTEWSSMQSSTKSTMTDAVQKEKTTTEVATQSTIDDVTQKIVASQCTMTEPAVRTDCATTCNLYEEQKALIKYVSCGTQHKYSTTTRSTCTSAFIKKHNVGTNFPESWPVSIEQILKETVMDLPVAIEPIDELPDHMLPRSIGTNTVIKDIRKNIGFTELKTVETNCENHTNNIKVEREMMNGLVLSGKKNQSDRLENSLKTMWSLFGNIIIGMICRKRDSETNSEELLAREFEIMIQNLNCNKAESSSNRDIATIHPNVIAGPPMNNENLEESSVCTEKQKERSPLRPCEEDCFKVEENSKDSSECLQNIGHLSELNDPFIEEPMQREIIHNSPQIYKNSEVLRKEQNLSDTTIPKKSTESTILFADIANHPNASALKTDQNNTKSKRKRKKKLLGLTEHHTKNKFEENGCNATYKLPTSPSIKFQGIKFVKEEKRSDHSTLNNASVKVQTFAEPFAKSPMCPPPKKLIRTGTNLKKDSNLFVVPKCESSLKVLDVTQVRINLQSNKLQTEHVQATPKIEQNISSPSPLQNVHQKESFISNSNTSISLSPTKDTFSPIKLTGVQKSQDSLLVCNGEHQDSSKVPPSKNKMEKKERRISFSMNKNSSKTENLPTAEKCLENEPIETNKQNGKTGLEIKQSGAVIIMNLESQSKVETFVASKSRRSSPTKEGLLDAFPATSTYIQHKDTELQATGSVRLNLQESSPLVQEVQIGQENSTETVNVPSVGKFLITEPTQINGHSQIVTGIATREINVKEALAASRNISNSQSESKPEKEISVAMSPASIETETRKQHSDNTNAVLRDAPLDSNGTFVSTEEQNSKKNGCNDTTNKNSENLQKMLNNLSDSDSDDDEKSLQICFGDEILPDLSSDDDENNTSIENLRTGKVSNEISQSGSESKGKEDSSLEVPKEIQPVNNTTIQNLSTILPELSMEEGENAKTNSMNNIEELVAALNQDKNVETDKDEPMFDEILPQLSSDEEDIQTANTNSEHISQTDKKLSISCDDEKECSVLSNGNNSDSQSIGSMSDFETSPKNTEFLQLSLTNAKEDESKSPFELAKCPQYKVPTSAYTETTYTPENERESRRKRKLSNTSADINDECVTKKVRRKSHNENYERDGNGVLHDFSLERKLSHLLENELDLPNSVQPIDDMSDEENDEISLPTSKTNHVDNVEVLQDFDSYESPLSPPSTNSSETSVSHPVVIPPEWKSTNNSSKSKQKKINSYMGSILSKYEKHGERCIPVKRTKESRSDRQQSDILNKIINSYLEKGYNNVLAPQMVEEIITSTTNVRLISLAIVHVVMNMKEISDAEFTCPPSELIDPIRIVLALIDELKKWKGDIVNDILFYIEKSIFVLNAKSFVYKDLINATLLYLKLAQMRKSRESPLRTFIFKCLYYHADWGLAMIYYTLLVHPKVLPHEKECIDDALTIAIKCILNSTPFSFTKPKQQELSAALKFRYGYQRVVPSREDAIKILMNKIHSGDCRNVSYAINLICRKNNEKWRSNVLESSLIPTLEEFCQNLEHSDEDEQKIATLVESISLIIKAFPVTYDVSTYQQIFFNILNNNKRKMVQEAAMRALLRLSRFGLVDCFNRTVKWKSRGRCSKVLKYMVQTLVYRKPYSYWKRLMDSNSMDKE